MLVTKNSNPKTILYDNTTQQFVTMRTLSSQTDVNFIQTIPTSLDFHITDQFSCIIPGSVGPKK